MDASEDTTAGTATNTPCHCHFCLSRRYSRRLLLGLAACVIGFAIYNYASFFKQTRNPLTTVAKIDKSHPLVNVLLGEASTADVPVYISALGSVVASKSVTIRSQINGVLLRLLFDEGQIVDADSLLAEIDARPYEAKLLQMQGQLTRDRALLYNAQLDLERYERLIKQDSVAQQTLDTQSALVKQYEGNVESDLGQIEAVRLNIDYCRIKSPIKGRAGLQLVDPGNLVQTSDSTGIVTVNTTRPIKVQFSIPEDQLTSVAQKIANGEELKVNIQDRTQNTLLTSGVLQTMDNQIEASTGTIKLQAEIANEDDLLFPNQFVNVQLLLETLEDALVVPTPAIQHGINGSFVYLLNKDNTVKITPVTVGVVSGNNTVVSGEITPGQKMVIQGADKLKDGMQVAILEQNLAESDLN